MLEGFCNKPLLTSFSMSAQSALVDFWLIPLEPLLPPERRLLLSILEPPVGGIELQQSANANSRLKGRVVIIFQGVDSAFHVWLNGEFVGFAKGSRLPCEFDVTDALTGAEEQCLCVRVVRWSDGSYLEDQDHWWLSGLYRDVELVLRPTPARISDFAVRCSPHCSWFNTTV